MAKHLTNDFCVFDVMEAVILKILLAWRRVSLFYDTEKRLLGNKWSSGVFKQHYLINHFDLLRKIRLFVHTRRNRIRIDHLISNGQEEGRIEKQYRNQTWYKDTYLFTKSFPKFKIVSRFSRGKPPSTPSNNFMKSCCFDDVTFCRIASCNVAPRK